MRINYKLHPLLEETRPPQRICEHLDCEKAGEYRAPISPSRLREYHWFCIDHVREYNLQWDFYKRMSQEEIERSRREDATWERPTWRFSHAPSQHNATHFRDPFELFPGQAPNGATASATRGWLLPHTEEAKALKTLDLSYPLDASILKKRYKELAKKYHPDLNRGCLDSQELLKKINQAYSVLKKIIR